MFCLHLWGRLQYTGCCWRAWRWPFVQLWFLLLYEFLLLFLIFCCWINSYCWFEFLFLLFISWWSFWVQRTRSRFILVGDRFRFEAKSFIFAASWLFSFEPSQITGSFGSNYQLLSTWASFHLLAAREERADCFLRPIHFQV